MRYHNEFALLPERAFQSLGGRMTLEGGDSGGGGGGSAAPTTSTNTSYSSSVQPELMPYATDIAQKAQTLSNASYTPYGGERIAGFTPLQQQAQTETAGMKTPGQFGQGTAMTTLGGIGSLGAQANYTAQATDPNAMQSYMSPYAQAAIDPTLRENQRNFDINQTQRNAQATGAGAFGGSRQAIVDAEAGRNLGMLQADTQAKGMQNAYQSAQQALQFGTQTGMQGYNQALQAGSTLGQLGGAQQGADLARLGAQGTAGAQQQALNQQGLTQQYQDFINQKNFPTAQLNAYSSLIRGLAPISPYQSTSTPAAPSAWNQLGGLATAGIGGLAYGMGRQ